MGMLSKEIMQVPYTGKIKPAIFAAYLSVVWLTWRFGIPLGPFSGIPIYILFTLILFFQIPGQVQRATIKLGSILIIYEFLKFIQPGFEFTIKGFFGIAACALIMSVTYYAIKVVYLCKPEWIGKWLRITLYFVFWAIIAELIINVFVHIMPDYVYVSYVFGTRAFAGFFQEPSHVALALSPYIFLIFYDYRLFRKYLGRKSLSIIIILSLLVTCSTLIATWLAAMGVAFILRLRHGKILSIIILGLLAALIITIALAVPQIYSRISSLLTAGAGIAALSQTASASHTQASALAFLKGFDMMRHAVGSFPLGVAFLNMRQMAPYSTLSYISEFMFDYNSNDGTSILFKGVCELGILFEIFTAASLILFLKKLIRKGNPDLPEALTMAFIFSFFMNFIRGSSYYHGTVTFGLALLIFHFFQPFLVTHMTATTMQQEPPPHTYT